ncbi:MAG: hypothetical protein ISS35_03515 [Kiritimatiellae bacterium]|nr:hypothetical protein [Kiritimatiellia bacterium]
MKIDDFRLMNVKCDCVFLAGAPFACSLARGSHYGNQFVGLLKQRFNESFFKDFIYDLQNALCKVFRSLFQVSAVHEGVLFPFLLIITHHSSLINLQCL